MSKPVVFVIGASGTIGSATVRSLSCKCPDKMEIRAGTRNPDKADKLKALKGVSVVQAEMGDKDRLVETFRGVNALYIVVPPTENCKEVCVATAEAAKAAGVKHLLLVSGTVVKQQDTLLGRLGLEIEVSVAAVGIPCTMLRMTYFVENYLNHTSSIAEHSKIALPVDPTKPFAVMAVDDAALAGATILSCPLKHANKMYMIISGRHTFGALTDGLSEILGRKIEFTRMPNEESIKTFLAFGYPEWVVTELLDFYQQVDAGALSVTQADDYLGDLGKESQVSQPPLSKHGWKRMLACSRSEWISSGKCESH